MRDARWSVWRAGGRRTERARLAIHCRGNGLDSSLKTASQDAGIIKAADDAFVTALGKQGEQRRGALRPKQSAWKNFRFFPSFLPFYNLRPSMRATHTLS
jgi:hypothetical protein